MPRPAVTEVLLAVVAGGALTGALPAEAGSPCSSTCRHTLVGERAVRWVSPQSFSAKAALEVTLVARGRELDADPIRSCAARFYGQGVAARVDTCGKPRAPLMLRAVNVEPRSAQLEIRYRAR